MAIGKLGCGSTGIGLYTIFYNEGRLHDHIGNDSIASCRPQHKTSFATTHIAAVDTQPTHTDIVHIRPIVGIACKIKGSKAYRYLIEVEVDVVDLLIVCAVESMARSSASVEGEIMDCGQGAVYTRGNAGELEAGTCLSQDAGLSTPAEVEVGYQRDSQAGKGKVANGYEPSSAYIETCLYSRSIVGRPITLGAEPLYAEGK